MSENTLVLKSINQLLEYKFFIPSYQRGYRWSDIQVGQLLDDIWDFAKKNKEINEFYCLQPIVVKKHEEDGWEVIDGQQRLTTIRIILSYLVKEHLKRPLKEAYNKTEYSICYETRPLSEEFLKNIYENTENIDFYHMWKAFEKAKNWFNDKDYNDCNEFLSILLAKDDNKNPVKIIWYEVNDGSNSYDIFTRLNIGKIQLTNSELIKALFLKKWNNSEAVDKLRLQQLKIASEWDKIENTLQDDSFWYFIHNKEKPNDIKYENRIEYIFDLITKKPEGNTEDEKYTFYKFYDEFDRSKNNSSNKIPDTDAIWLRVKKFFLTFEEWFKDRELYHLIGFLIETGSKIQDILNPSNTRVEVKSKTDFKKFLINEIRKKVSFDIKKLQYGDKEIKIVLLLFNIQTILTNNKSNMRFPFNLYKNQDWDIEHIRSQTEKKLVGNDRKEWVKDILEYFTGSDSFEKQNNFINNIENQEYSFFRSPQEKEEIKPMLKKLLDLVSSDRIDDIKFNELYAEICKKFGENNEPSESAISNLAILDSATNRSYKNAFFPIKRKIILKNDKNGSFIPICTRNLFMKAYSKRFDEIMYWNKFDAEDYLKEIEKELIDYLPKADLNDGN